MTSMTERMADYTNLNGYMNNQRLKGRLGNPSLRAPVRFAQIPHNTALEQITEDGYDNLLNKREYISINGKIVRRLPWQNAVTPLKSLPDWVLTNRDKSIDIGRVKNLAHVGRINDAISATSLGLSRQSLEENKKNFEELKEQLQNMIKNEPDVSEIDSNLRPLMAGELAVTKPERETVEEMGKTLSELEGNPDDSDIRDRLGRLFEELVRKFDERRRREESDRGESNEVLFFYRLSEDGITDPSTLSENDFFVHVNERPKNVVRRFVDSRLGDGKLMVLLNGKRVYIDAENIRRVIWDPKGMRSVKPENIMGWKSNEEIERLTGQSPDAIVL